MSIRNAGKTIREARMNSGLSQEQFSEGICSSLSLSRIENGASGVSPSTFQALMSRAGIRCDLFPVFANRTEFDCYYALKLARFFLEHWQLERAFEKLDEVEQLAWADNKLYYQEWLMLHNRLQFRSGCCDHNEVLASLWDAIHITRLYFSLSDFSSLLLTTCEIEILTLLAQEYFYLGELELCHTLCSQLYSQIQGLQISYLEKSLLTAEESIVYIKYLIATGDYKKAFELSDFHRHAMVLDRHDSPLFELYFLTGLSAYHLGKTDIFKQHFKNAFYASHSIHSPFSTMCYDDVPSLDASFLTEDMISLDKIKLHAFPRKKTIDSSGFSDGIYDPFSDEIFSIGSLIRDFRKEQKLSQSVLCQGLCSKSMLSKIESGTIQPDIFLAEALLQRLGISERIFTFWGNDLDAELYELKFKLSRLQLLSETERQDLMDEFYELLPKNHKILLQYYLLVKATVTDDFVEGESLLWEALHMTLPNFSFSLIHTYRLSWYELSILNKIALLNKDTENNYKTISYFYMILDYWKSSPNDYFLQSGTYCSMLYFFCSTLYRQKRFSEIKDTLCPDDYPIHYLFLHSYGFFLFYYSQSLGECSDFLGVKRYGSYAYALLNLFESNENANSLYQCLQEDFNIVID